MQNADNQMAKEISPELKKQAKAAWDNQKDFYTCIATGNTYPVKDDFQTWGFFWSPEKKAWESECTTEWEKFLFERYVADNDWPGVKLEFTKEEAIKEEQK